MGKVIVCHCEDITLDELRTALVQGYAEIESLKRYTGIGTGKCQGKCCIVQTLRVLGSDEGRRLIARGRTAGPGEPLGEPPPEADMLRIPTVRQPATPVDIGTLADAWEGPRGEEP
jgi:bacterioferritin-associated ferredoxin